MKIAIEEQIIKESQLNAVFLSLLISIAYQLEIDVKKALNDNEIKFKEV